MIEQFHGPVLVIVARPDDIEAHCAGTIARLVDQGEEVIDQMRQWRAEWYGQ